MHTITKCTIIIIVILSFSYINISAQTASVKGFVVDSVSGTPVEFASVGITYQSDESLVTYTLTKKDGSFRLINLPSNRKLYLFVSHVGSNSVRRDIILSSNKIIEVDPVKLNNLSLKEVVIVGAKAPVITRNDTIEYRAEAFNSLLNANVEALLKKLPGVQVFTNGAIVINGKPVSKIKINGRDFFANNTLIATKNLDAEVIDKIQIFDEKGSSQPIYESSSSKVINLVLKSKFKKSLFGKAYVGGGTASHHEVGGIANSLMDTLQVSVVALGNNLNQAGFNLQELGSMGGFGKVNNNILTSSIDWGGRFSGGIQTIRTYGLNIGYNGFKNFNFTFLYYGSVEKNKFENHSLTKSIIGDTTLNTVTQNNSTQLRHLQNFEPTFDWQMSKTVHIKFDSKFAISSTEDNVNVSNSRSNNVSNLRNKNTDVNISARKQIEYRHNINIQKSFQGGKLNFNQKLVVSPTTEYKDFNSLLVSTDSSGILSTFYRHYVINIPGTKVEFESSYDHRLSKTLQATFGIAERNNYIGYHRLLGNLSTFYDRATEEGRVKRIEKDLVIKAMISWKLKKLSFVGGILNHFQSIQNKNDNPSFNASNNVYIPMPQLNVGIGPFSLGFKSAIEQPNISDLIPGEYQINKLTAIKGNPNLKYTKRYDVNMTYYKYSTEKKAFINFYGNYSKTIDPISYLSNVTSEGIYIQQPKNLKVSENTTFGTTYSKMLTSKSSLITNLTFNCFMLSQRNDFGINGNYGIQRFNQVGVAPKLDLSYKKLFDFETGYNLTAQLTSYDDIGYQNFKSIFNSLYSKINVNWPSTIIYSPSLYYLKSSKVLAGQSNDFNQLNLTITYLPRKSKSQLKLTCFDLLNSNKGFSSTANTNNNTVGNYLVLNRYFLLTYQYKFIKVNKKELKKGLKSTQ